MSGPLAQVTLGGQAAIRVELPCRQRMDVVAWDQGEWRSWDRPGVRGEPTRATMRVAGSMSSYMVDVDRSPLVIDASHRAAATAADLAEPRLSSHR